MKHSEDRLCIRAHLLHSEILILQVSLIGQDNALIDVDLCTVSVIFLFLHVLVNAPRRANLLISALAYNNEHILCLILREPVDIA
jgi:hypothetical protein